eukprot:CAMPEP_0175959516 /NCGR_PEP_ID=MMETSP0108-20121206/34838_1 /TAXON_ID=195067 ORGANISM="Goniomonas pacifica, Strain CCMP1869" /NCGR_SAMPLE_ID=MMETSP0108 /ASSEMBLY_ACC=CAM_ASM_000204 /LENGTH=108 /DNA_ID=CAMNT_0017286973 /DNA_START=34 /DNA_END=360 /DNA_ORIENTATION=-
MPVLHPTTTEEFQAFLKDAGTKVVIVDWSATWCGPCKKIAPVLEAMSEEFAATHVFLKCDVDQLGDLTAEHGVEAMPTFHVFKGGERVKDKQVRGADEGALRRLVQEA